MKLSIGVLAFLILCFRPLLRAPWASEKGILLTEDTELKVAAAFMGEREYYRAITEYKKFLILFPESDKADYALLKIGMAYYHGEEYEASAVYNENYAVAAIVGGIGLPFYLGNIYGSANAAKKWNIAVRNELRNRISVTLDYGF